MLTATAVSLGVSLAEAAAFVTSQSAYPRRLHFACDSPVQLSSQDQLSDDAGDVDLVGRLHLQLLDHMDNEAIVASVAAASAALWDDEAPVSMSGLMSATGR